MTPFHRYLSLPVTVVMLVLTASLETARANTLSPTQRQALIRLREIAGGSNRAMFQTYVNRLYPAEWASVSRRLDVPLTKMAGTAPLDDVFGVFVMGLGLVSAEELVNEKSTNPARWNQVKFLLELNREWFTAKDPYLAQAVWASLIRVREMPESGGQRRLLAPVMRQASQFAGRELAAGPGRIAVR